MSFSEISNFCVKVGTNTHEATFPHRQRQDKWDRVHLFYMFPVFQVQVEHEGRDAAAQNPSVH